jgi:D-alanyl-D-alanine carboxypeptidase/D-alanyl-D-alanine-endopeptidase (penicillin-binding protein 4)
VSEPEAPATGIAALIRRHPVAWLAAALAIVFVMLGTGAVAVGVAVGRPDAPSAPPTPPPTSAPEGGPARALPESVPGATRLRTCSVATLAADPRLGSFSGYVLNPATGETLFSRGGDVPSPTGGVLAVLTASAAVAVLGPDYRMSTRVVEGSEPGTVVLVGGGDPTLSAAASSVYAGAPRIADLATAAKAAHAAKYPGVPITRVILDSTYWSDADKWDPSWKRSEQAIGYHAEVTALMVDGDRADPAQATSPRSTDPVGRAGAAFAAALGGAPAVTVGSAPGTTLLAEVQSQPLSSLVEYMLLAGDSTLAENLARVVSVASGFGGSAVSLQQAIPSALAGFGVPVDSLVVRDGSGLGQANAVPPEYVARLMAKILADEQGLDVVHRALPVAGQSGSLSSRFTGTNSVARGAVTAKPGWIDTAHALGGIVKAADGTSLTFAFAAVGGGVGETAQDALDALTASVFTCGDNLSNL